MAPKKSTLDKTAKNLAKAKGDERTLRKKEKHAASEENSDTGTQLCKVCERIFIQEDELLQCERCDQWLCYNCSQLKQTEFEFLSQHQSSLLYCCTTCREYAISAIKSDNIVAEK